MNEDEVRHLLFKQHIEIEGVGFEGQNAHISFKSKEYRDSFTRKTIDGRSIIKGGYKDWQGNKYFANGDKMVIIGYQDGIPCYGAEDCTHIKGVG